MANRVRFLYDDYLDNPNTTVRIYNTFNNNDLILKAFYQDDFTISITNQWQTGDSTIVKQLVDAAAGIVTGRSGKMYTEFINWGLDKINPDTQEGKNLKSGIQSFVNKTQDLQNSHIFSADDFYKTFKGTTVTFPLNLQVQLVSDEVNPINDIYDKLRKILSVSIGDYKTAALGFVGIQNAPNGFKSGTLNLAKDKLLEGTLKVIYGDPSRGGYLLDNMVISNVHATFSKTKVEIRPNVFRPLYIDLQILLEPGKKFTRTNIERNLGMPRGSIRASRNLVLTSGRNPKEEREDSIARRKYLQLIEDTKLKDQRDAQFEEDLASQFPGLKYKVEDGIMKIYGELDDEDYQAYKTSLGSIDMKSYGVDGIASDGLILKSD